MELYSPKTEEKILDFWKREQVFEKTLKNRAKSKPFVFFEGPPSANGRPGIHHVLARVYKDIICRYKTMDGFFVSRKAGWDTHGLPIELQVEKELGLKNKKDIEKYGVAKFNRKAQETVWKYKEEWDKITERIGFWLDLKNPYITYEPEYIESLWNILSRIAKKRLLYKDFKVVPYCSRCGTALSSHEVALGYDRVSENSVYLKFKLKPGQAVKIFGKGENFMTSGNTYILSWTTTPWTLPGNVALAVGEKIDYEILKLKNSEFLIFARNLKEAIKIEGEKENSLFTSGKNLIGLKYQPLFNIPKLVSKTSYEVYPADFVTVEDGTGVVHTAVMYGEDDFKLGRKVGLPKYHTVDLDGKFVKGIGLGLDGAPVKDGRTEKIILEFLKNQGALLRVAKYEHDYPFCWRCDSPLIYYAKSSWFIRMEKLKNQLVKNNKKINWVPGHIKEGRFGEWLREIKDWAISRERYWGTPLPLWRCEKCGAEKVIGSLGEFDKLSLRKPNRYVFLRHGEAENNRLGILSSYPESKSYKLTIGGAREIEKLIPSFKKKKIDLVFSSDIFRAKETAQIIGGALGKKIIYDKRLRERDFGASNGISREKWLDFFKGESDRHLLRPQGGESFEDVENRMMDFLNFLDRKYQGKNILIISHADPVIAGVSVYEGGKSEDFSKNKKFSAIHEKTGTIFEITGHNWPRDDSGKLDLHRPFVDEIKIKCPKCSGKMKREKDVVDVWFDSGAMPFAQIHWPFSVKGGSSVGKAPLTYPADYISEAVDQTRGWFYTLHAVGALLGKGEAFKNVICLGHVLDEKGEKMSKSKGNVVDPWEVINKSGIDALRWYFFTINPPGEPKRFAVRDVEEKLRRFILTLSNVLAFYKTYGIETRGEGKNPGSDNPLDKWILSRLNQTIKSVRKNLDDYEVTQAARPIDDFVDDLSRWWLRRSRKRFSNGEKSVASENLKFILEELAKVIAPFTPFLAEHIWQELGHRESVHLSDYPKTRAKLIDEKLEHDMGLAREAAAKGLALRAETGIKVRQPLQKIKIKKSKFKILDDGLLNLLKDEINVKEAVFDENIKSEVELDTNITAELKEEGIIRELARQVQEARRDGGLVPGEPIEIYFKTENRNLIGVIEKWDKELKNNTGAGKIESIGAEKGNLLVSRELAIENQKIWIGIRKI